MGALPSHGLISWGWDDPRPEEKLLSLREVLRRRGVGARSAGFDRPSPGCSLHRTIPAGVMQPGQGLARRETVEKAPTSDTPPESWAVDFVCYQH